MISILLFHTFCYKRSYAVMINVLLLFSLMSCLYFLSWSRRLDSFHRFELSIIVVLFRSVCILLNYYFSIIDQVFHVILVNGY